MALPHLARGLVARASAALASDDAASAAAYPGEATTRQPVHTCYVPADTASAATAREWGAAALDLMAAVDPGLPDDLAARVRAKLSTQPVEDLRIDLEDGYGNRPDDEEDADADAAGATLAALGLDPEGPFVAGVRIKSLQRGTRARALNSLVRVVDAALSTDGAWPHNRFVVTLPKVTSVAQVAAMADILAAIETERDLPVGCLRLELQIEVPQAVVGPDGSVAVARMVQAAQRRCEGLHYGTYDFSAAAGVSGGHQASDHPLADQAKELMQLAAAGTGARVVDGSTNVLPVGAPDAVRAAWDGHARLVRRALERALYQGWDLHPGQLVTRYATTYAFHRTEMATAAGRLRAYMRKSTGSGGTLDEPATARALASAVLRGVECGAVDMAEAIRATGLDRGALDRLAGRA